MAPVGAFIFGSVDFNWCLGELHGLLGERVVVTIETGPGALVAVLGGVLRSVAEVSGREFYIALVDQGDGSASIVLVPEPVHRGARWDGGRLVLEQGRLVVSFAR
ncbi:MAG: hypothetical protein V7607_5065 [Solirubrobacteraceae bacterium]